MPNEIVPVLRGTVLDDESGLTLDELCTMCRQRAEAIITMVKRESWTRKKAKTRQPGDSRAPV